jgi:L,D-transpeptidase YbiS
LKNRHQLLAAMALATSLIASGAFAAEQAPQQPQKLEKPCHWWQFRKCDNVVPDDALPPEAPREGAVISIDVGTNTAYLYKDGELVTKSLAATGSEKTLEHGEDMWVFHTPRGRHKVLRKIVDPVWRKPDWAFIEAGEKVPPPDSPKRMVKGHLGKYALDLGEGIMIHGTDDPGSIGKRVSHGCIRLPDKMLAKVYKEARVGTEVFIFDSRAGTSESVAGGD